MVEMYIHEILEGKPDIGYKGLYPLIEEYMDQQRFNKEEVAKVRTFMAFLMDRSKGLVPTGAKFIRNFVLNHPEYN